MHESIFPIGNGTNNNHILCAVSDTLQAISRNARDYIFNSVMIFLLSTKF